MTDAAYVSAYQLLFPASVKFILRRLHDWVTPAYLDDVSRRQERRRISEDVASEVWVAIWRLRDHLKFPGEPFL